MNALEIFKELGIKPTHDYKEIRSVYISKLKKLQAKVIKSRGSDEEQKVEDDILKLNEAFNLLTPDNTEEMKIRAEAIRTDQEMLPASLRKTIKYESVERESKPGETIKDVLNSIETNWEDKDLDNVTEYITFHDFLNGSAMMFEDNSTINIPAGFLGLMSRVVDNKVQFIKIKNKDSVTFSFDSTGNILLKTPPEDARFEDHTLYINVKEREFAFDLSKCKYMKKKNLWVGQGFGIKAYKSKKAGDLLIQIDMLKSNKNQKVVEQIKEYLQSREGETI